MKKTYLLSIIIVLIFLIGCYGSFPDTSSSMDSTFNSNEEGFFANLEENENTTKSSLEKVKNNLFLSINTTDKDYDCVIANIENNSGFFKYYARISDNAEEYLFASGISEGTLIYDNGYRYILKGDELLEKTSDMKYMFNENKVPEKEILNEINTILKKYDLTLCDLRKAMQIIYVEK